MANSHIERLRALTREVQDARAQHRDDQVTKAVNQYDEALERCAKASRLEMISSPLTRRAW
jgi:hypothetical protein